MRLLLRSLGFLLLWMPAVWAACPSRTYTYTTGQAIDPSQVTTNEDNLYTYACAVDTFADGSIATADLADNAVTSAKIAADTIVAADIAADAVGTSEIATDGVDAAEIAAGAVGASELASGAVDAGDMATTGTIADDKVFVADSSSAATWRTITNCTDTGGNHLNYTQSTNSFSCGTSGDGTGTDVGGTNAAVVHRTAGNVAITDETQFVDVTGASITITTGANPILVGFAFTYVSDNATDQVGFNVDVDGTDQLGAEGLLYHVATVSEGLNGSFTMMTTDLSAASHTIKIQAKNTSTFSATVVCSSDTPCNFWVVEVVD